MVRPGCFKLLFAQPVKLGVLRTKSRFNNSRFLLAFHNNFSNFDMCPVMHIERERLVSLFGVWKCNVRFVCRFEVPCLRLSPQSIHDSTLLTTVLSIWNSCPDPTVATILTTSTRPDCVSCTCLCSSKLVGCLLESGVRVRRP